MSTPHSAASSPPDRAHAAFADDVARMLTRSPRQLPTHYLYDRLGSSLFEAICRLPWYRIPDIEQRLLERHAAKIFASLDPVSTVIELGPGSGEKLVTLIARGARGAIAVDLIDVSAEALEHATRTLSALTAVSLVTHEATYEQGLSAIGDRGEPGRRLVVFLGSNIGNFEPPAAAALLHVVRSAVHAGDGILLGADLVKPEADLLLAYDDPLGVTAAFNRNLLVRMNRELGSNFDVKAFVHRALWNAAESRMEMYLVSTRRQQVRIPAAGLDLTFQDGEAIWTESSYKYRAADLASMLGDAGFTTSNQWIEDGFALTLGEAI